jgi:hypothetical protein
MKNLLNANFSHLWQNGMFKIAIAAAAFVGIFCPIFYHRLLVVLEAPQSSYSLDYYFLPYSHVIAVIATAFCSYYMSIDQTNGTLRNKIIAGHKRISIYMANLMTNMSVSCMLYTVYLVLSLGIGSSYIGHFQRYANTEMLLYVFCGYAAIIALTAVVTWVSMLFPNMAISLGVSLCVVLGSLCVGVHQLSQLTNAIVWMDQMTKMRQRILFFADFLPGSQLMEFFAMKDQLGNMNATVMLSGSAVFFVGMTIIGLISFQNKSLK